MTDAREIINAACHDANQYRDRTYASAVIQSLTASGFRILGPDEFDGPTVEKCAEVAEVHSAELWPKARKPNRSELDVAIFESAASEADAIASAIRALASMIGYDGASS